MSTQEAGVVRVVKVVVVGRVVVVVVNVWQLVPLKPIRLKNSNF